MGENNITVAVKTAEIKEQSGFVKKSIICMLAITAMIFISQSVFAETITYYTTDESVTADIAEGKKTVMIVSEDGNNIVYVDQDDSTFGAAAKFLLKQNTPEGKYIIRLNNGGTVVTSSFYIGVDPNAGDWKMNLIEGEKGYVEVKDKDGNVTSYNVGYTVTASGTKEFKTVIIKMDNKLYGISLTNPLSIDGDNISLGIQINTSSRADAGTIQGVWLSERTFDSDKKLTDKQEAQQ